MNVVLKEKGMNGMKKNVLILSGSPRKNGNSELLCEEFLRGADEAGHEVEIVPLFDKKINYCRGCYYCEEHGGTCAIKDDMAGILEKISEADVIVLASPVYFYSICAQMKAVIDRCVAKWKEIKNKEFYYIMTAGEDSDTVMDCTLECFRGFANCLEGSVEKGVICAKGVYEKGEVKITPYMQEAYEMGKSIN